MAVVILLGYMGSGKSTVANAIGAQTGWPVIDLDAVIEARVGQSIPTIFSEKGELYFRKQEREALQEVLMRRDSFVLATGGGTPCYYDNIEVMNQHGHTFFLQGSVGTLAERLRSSATQRPLLNGLSEEEQSEFIAKHLFERNTFYQQAQHTLSVNGKSPETIAAEIVAKLA